MRDRSRNPLDIDPLGPLASTSLVQRELEATRAERDRYRAAVDRALGLIETASSRARINEARDVLKEALDAG